MIEKQREEGDTLDLAVTPDTFASAVFADSGQERLRAQGELFLCQDKSQVQSFSKSWIIDADDTLWEDNLYYEQIMGTLADYLINGGISDTPAAIRQKINDIELETIKEVGFGPRGFLRSMEQAFDTICNEHGVKLKPPGEIFDSIIPTLTNVPQDVPVEIGQTLQALRDRGDGLILFTQGPIDIQQHKVARSELAEYFHCIAIATNKKTAMYQRVLDDVVHSLGNVTVVGNSIKSEILPALKLGLGAVHFLNPNTWHGGNHAEVDDNAGVIEIRSIPELLDLNQA